MGSGGGTPKGWYDVVGGYDPAKGELHAVREMALNALTLSRQALSRTLGDPRRSVEDECGHPRDEPTPAEYQWLFDHDAFANRVVRVLARETWRVQPEVYESEDQNVTTPFEAVWGGLAKGLRGGGHYRGKRGSPVWEALRRVDELCGVGRYGILLIGLDDGRALDRPADLTPGGGPTARRKLLFLRAFPESLAPITRFESDPASPRFGQPVMYSVTFNDPRQGHQAAGTTTATREVHWTRALHVADNVESSEVFGAPRMRPVYNRLLDLKKLLGGSAEMYWRGAFPGYSWETNPNLGGDADVNIPALRDTMENFFNGLQRYVIGQGMSLKSLAPQVVDPGPQVLAQIEAICVQLAIPRRIFMGSERGELASSQDDAKWDDILVSREDGQVNPREVIPLVERLIDLSVLPAPADGFESDWPDRSSQTDEQRANIALVRTQAAAAYVSGNVKVLVPPVDYLSRWQGFTEEEAQEMAEEAAKIEEQQKAEEAEKFDKELAAKAKQPAAAGPPNRLNGVR